MEINDILGASEVVKTLGAGIGKVYDDFVSIPLNMSRIKNSDGVELEITEKGFKLYKCNEEIYFESLTFDSQQEVLKLRNQMNALNNLFINVQDNMLSNENIIKKFKMITESDRLYILEKFKYEDDPEKVNIINKIIADKLESEEEFSRVTFDFILSLTKKDILVLQELKKLILHYCRTSEFEAEVLVINQGKKVKKIIQNHRDIILPYVSTIDDLRKLKLNLGWHQINEFSMRGLYSTSSMILQIPKVEKNINNIIYEHYFQYNDTTYKLDTPGGEFKIFLLSDLGKQVFEYIPESGVAENYMQFLNTSNIMPGILLEENNLQDIWDNSKMRF